MPSVNLELVRAMCPAGARGDYSSADWARPEIEGLMPDPHALVSISTAGTNDAR